MIDSILSLSSVAPALAVFTPLNWGQALSNLGFLTDVCFPIGINKVVQSTIIIVMVDSEELCR